MIAVAHAQISLYLLLVESDGVHQCRLAVVQVGILRLHVLYVAPEHFAQYAEEELYGNEKDENIGEEGFPQIGCNDSVGRQTDGCNDEWRVFDKTYHEKHHGQERCYLIDKNKMQKIVGMFLCEIDKTGYHDRLSRQNIIRPSV